MALRSTPNNIITSSGGTITGNTNFPNGINVYSEAVASNSANDDVRYYKLARVRFATPYGRSLFNIKVYHTGSNLKIGNIKGYFYNGATKRSLHVTSFLMVINNSGSTGFIANDLSYVPLDSGSDTNDYIVDVYMKIGNYARIYENTESATFENSSTLTIKPDGSTVVVSLPIAGTTTSIDGVTYTYGTFVSGIITSDLNSQTATTLNAIPKFADTAGQLVGSQKLSINASDQLVSTVSTGTAPFSVASNTVVTNLNADLLDGKHYSDITSYVGASGVTNLLKNSSWRSDGTSWSNIGWTRNTTNIIDSTAMSYSISRTGLSVDTEQYILQGSTGFNPISAKQGDTFTFSIWVKTPDYTLIDGGGVTIDFAEKNVSLANIITAGQTSIKPTANNVWQKFTRTYVIIEALAAYITIIIRINRNGTIYITKPQLERGNYATDWIPSVADIADGTYTAPSSILQPVKCTTYAGSNITLTGLQTIDGISCVAGDRVLVASQTNGVENGIYVVSSGAWSRSGDSLVANTLVNVERGTSWADSIITLITDSPITVGTTALTFRLLGTPVSNTKITNEGGIAVRMLNKTGANSVKGSCVQISDTTDNGFKLTVTGGFTAIGFVYESGIADGSLCWVVVTGIAEVLIEDSVATVRGDILIPSGTVAGRVMPQALPTSAQHFQEVGHPIESKSAGTNVLAKITIHFN